MKVCLWNISGFMLTGETEVKVYLEKRLLKFLHVERKCQINWPDIEPGPAQRQFCDYPPEACKALKSFSIVFNFCNVKAKRPQVCPS